MNMNWEEFDKENGIDPTLGYLVRLMRGPTFYTSDIMSLIFETQVLDKSAKPEYPLDFNMVNECKELDAVAMDYEQGREDMKKEILAELENDMEFNSEIVRSAKNMGGTVTETDKIHSILKNIALNQLKDKIARLA